MTEINNNFTLNNKEIDNKHTEEMERIKNDTRKIENDYLIEKKIIEKQQQDSKHQH